VYFFYPDVPFVTGDVLTYALPRVEQMCNSMTAPRCHFINTRPLFQGHPEYFGLDPIHPNTTGAAVIGNAVWSKMAADCVAQ
jgi:hypothetical protein